MRRRYISLLVVLVLLIGAIASQVTTVREVGEKINSYTTNAGELTNSALVGQTFQAKADDLSAIAVMFATYSGRDNTEEIEFHLRRGTGEATDLRTGVVRPGTLGDNQFHRFEFEPIENSAGQTFFFFVVSPTSSVGNAVTVDLDTRDPYHLGSAYLVRGEGAKGNDPAALDRSGKPSIDVVFEAYYSVPWRVATVNSAVGLVRHLIVTWDQSRSTYALWAKVGAMAALAFGLSMVALKIPLKSTKWALGILFVLAVVVRLMYATELPLTNDEGNYLYDARSLLEGTLAGGDGYVKAPLVVLWVALWSLLDQSILVGRLSSVVIGALTLFPLYGLVATLASKRAGLVTATLWSLLGVTTVFNIYVHTQPLALFFGVSGVAVLAMALRGRLSPKVGWYILAGFLLGLGVVSRKSILALGLVPLVLIWVEGRTWRLRLNFLLLVAAGFLIVMAAFLTFAGVTYGVEGFWEALGVNSAEDGLNSVEPSQVEQVRAYSLRGMTPFFRESLPLIMLAVIGLGVLLERLLTNITPGEGSGDPTPRVYRRYIVKLIWLVPLAAFWWAWGFFGEYEGSSIMVFGMERLWYAMAAVILLVAVLPAVKQYSSPRPQLAAILVPTLWMGGLVFFYMNWIKFHANYIGEFLLPLVILSGMAVPAIWERLKALRWATVRLLSGLFISAILLWALFVSGYVTFWFEHTGTFQQGAVEEAALWAAKNIPLDEPIFTGAGVVPYLSGHHTALNIAHPRWYAYEFTRKDTTRLNTFLPSAEEMVQAFRDTQWFLLDKQTGFSFLMEYSEIEAGLERDFESVKGISNGSNTLTFYRRVR